MERKVSISKVSCLRVFFIVITLGLIACDINKENVRGKFERVLFVLKGQLLTVPSTVLQEHFHKTWSIAVILMVQ